MKLFIAQTVDGYIAGDGGTMDHLAPFEGNDYGYADHIAGVDAVVMGRTTFDWLYPKHGWTYPPELPGIVMTSRPLPAGVPSQVAAATDPAAVARRYPNAYLDGGGETIRAFLEAGLISEARIFTLPILLGRGVRLFPSGTTTIRRWKLLDVKTYPCGTVCHRYATTPETA